MFVDQGLQRFGGLPVMSTALEGHRGFAHIVVDGSTLYRFYS
jgi:hypothetical protein